MKGVTEFFRVNYVAQHTVALRHKLHPRCAIDHGLTVDHAFPFGKSYPPTSREWLGNAIGDVRIAFPWKFLSLWDR